MQTDKGRGALAGLNVIDFGHYYAGPLTAMMLADQGANVIHIVKPNGIGDSTCCTEIREQQFRLLNRNKKVLMLNLKTPEGKARVQSLIEKADVLIENFRPGVMKRLGLDYAHVKGSNPGLIYLSLPGFASTDKERASIQAWEGVIGAASGLYTETQINRQLLGFPPVYTLVPLRSMHGGIFGAIAVMAALLARERHGYGTVIEVPLCEVAMFNLSFFMMSKRPSGAFRAVADPNAELPDVLKPLVYSPGDSEKVQLEKLEKARDVTLPFHPCYGHYLCSNERQVFINTFMYPHITERLLKALGIYKQVLREGFVNVSGWETGLENNVCNLFIGGKYKERLKELIGEAMKTRTAEEWETLLTGAGVMAAMVRSRDEWLALEPMLESGVLARMGEGQSALTVPARAGSVSGSGSEAPGEQYREPQWIDVEQADNLFQNVPPRQAPLSERPLIKKSDLLKGLKVVDMSNVAAGPICSYLLAEYGAEVIKADQPLSYPDAIIASGIVIGSQNKLSLLMDVKTVHGREIFRRLVAWADVVTHNILDDTAERLGATHTQLQAINPNVVSSQVTAFSGNRRGGWENRPGFDFSLHAASGQMAQYGTLNRPFVHGMLSTADTPGGFLQAFTTLLGVWQQRKTGHAGEARTSLAHAINYSQLPYMISENGNSNWGESRGQFAVGDHWWQRLYQCSDGWLFVGAHEHRAGELAEAVTGNYKGDDTSLAAAFLTRDRAYWETKLRALDIGCHRTMTVDDIYEAAPKRAVSNEEADETIDGPQEILRWNDHPCGIPFVMPAASWVRVGEERSWKRMRVAPKIGQDTVEILRKLEYSQEQIEEFIRLKVSYEFHPGIGSKDAYFGPIN